MWFDKNNFSTYLYRHVVAYWHKKVFERPKLTFPDFLECSRGHVLICAILLHSLSYFWELFLSTLRYLFSLACFFFSQGRCCAYYDKSLGRVIEDYNNRCSLCPFKYQSDKCFESKTLYIYTIVHMFIFFNFF